MLSNLAILPWMLLERLPEKKRQVQNIGLCVTNKTK
jgi:hypothetical protein